MLTSSQTLVLLLVTCVFIEHTQATQLIPMMGHSRGAMGYPQMSSQQQQQLQRSMQMGGVGVGGASMKPMIAKALLKKALLKKFMLAKLALTLMGGKLLQAKSGSGMNFEKDKLIDLSALGGLAGLLGADDSLLFKRTMESAAEAPTASTAAVEEPQQQAGEAVTEVTPEAEQKPTVESEQQKNV